MPSIPVRARTADTDVAILCGGRGTRILPALPHRPKALAPLGDTTFIDFLLGALENAGFRRFTLCTGHLGDQIREHIQPPEGVEIRYSIEDAPLGTGGALAKASPLLRSDPILVTNGDSFCEIDYPSLLSDHATHGAELTLVITHLDETSEYGTVHFSSDHVLTRFEEKSGTHAPGWVSAGVYVMNANLLELLPNQGPLSLEKDIFPSLCDRAGIRVYTCSGHFFDIGTPARLSRFRDWIEVRRRHGNNSEDSPTASSTN